MHYKKRPRSSDEPRLLPLDFDIAPDLVMIGRGRRCLNNEGNRRFRAMVKAELHDYSTGKKGTKSNIIKKILRHVRNSCPDGIGFIKQDACTGRYYTATENAAKVTIAQAFRDALNDGYKSSKHHKQLKRDLARGKMSPGDPDGICSTCKDELKAAQAQNLEDPPVLFVPGVATSIKNTIIKTGKDESSLFFWEGNPDDIPAIQGESIVKENHQHGHHHTMSAAHRCHEHHAGVGSDDWSMPQMPALQLSSYQDNQPRITAQLPKKMSKTDSYEPVPFSEAMKDLDEAMESNPAFTPESDDSESSSDVGITDDEEDAMVAWSEEFVHCPRCALIEGKHDFGELPIHDIQQALIG